MNKLKGNHLAFSIFLKEELKNPKVARAYKRYGKERIFMKRKLYTHEDFEKEFINTSRKRAEYEREYTKLLSKINFRRFEDVQLEYYCKHPDEIKPYIALSLEEYQKDTDEKLFLYSIRLALKAAGSAKKYSRKKRLILLNLNKTISNARILRFSTVMAVMKAFGLTLKVV